MGSRNQPRPLVEVREEPNPAHWPVTEARRHSARGSVLFPHENKLFRMSKTIRAFMMFYLRANFSHMSHDVFQCHVPCRAQVGGEGRSPLLFEAFVFSGGRPLDGSRDACCTA